MIEIIKRICFVIAVWQAFKKTQYGPVYAVVDKHGVPCITLFVAQGREAWKVSEFAIGFFASRGFYSA